jgi:hypothetical protein
VSALVPSADVPIEAATAVVSLGAAAIFGYVGYRLFRRNVSPGVRLASTQLALWWGGLGVSVGVGAVEIVLALAGALSYPAALTAYLVVVLIDCAFLWGLVGFLTFVYTGSYHLYAVTGFYIWFYVTVLYYIFSQHPYAVTLVAGQPTIQYLAAPVPVLEGILVVGLIFPEVIGGILYLSLLWRTTDTARRYRIALVGGGILLWFALDVFVPGTSTGWLLVRSVLQVVPGVMSLIAFYPPAWARRRYGVTNVDESLAAAAEKAAP